MNPLRAAGHLPALRANSRLSQAAAFILIYTSHQQEQVASSHSDDGTPVGNTVKPGLVERDTEARVEELPDDFKAALDGSPAAAEHFNKLSFSRQKEYCLWITGAKKPETRARRIEKALRMLVENK